MLTDGIPEFAAHLADRYRVEREIGRGGWGLVFAAHDLRGDRTVAVKLLRGEFTGSVSSARFMREIEILSRLDHPHIVTLYDWGQFKGAPWYAMSYVEGESLAERLEREGPLAIGEALRIAADVADALAHAHAAGIVHRDIKPANILLQDGFVRVADFGIARAMSRDASLVSISSSGMQIGTPTYMSPEQATAGSDIDGRSDIYSLGCVLYEMLTGEPPFTSATSTALVARHVLDPVPPISTVRRSVPKSVEEVVYKALSKSPADRFASAAEFGRALSAVAGEPGVSVVSTRGGARRRIVAVVAAASAVAALGLAGVAASNALDARAVAAADTTRWVLFPLQKTGNGPALQDADAGLRRSIVRWNGLRVLDASTGRGPPRSEAAATDRHDARTLSLKLHAGRYVVGSYAPSAGGTRIYAALYDVAGDQVPLIEDTEIASSVPGAIDSALTRVSRRLIFRTTDSVALSGENAGTKSIPAQQSFLAGWNALQKWNLSVADSQFAAATRFDAGYARALLWLALARVWAGRPATTWKFAAQGAASARAALPKADQMMSDALSALAADDRPRACVLWEQLTRAAPASFSAWYGAADCLTRDRSVVPDERSATGWNFRSGYHTALVRYQHAFERNPAILGALRDDAFERVRRLLWTTGTDIRIGTNDALAPVTFLSYPSIDHDTLAFVPFPMDRINAADPETMARIPRSVGMAVQRQRELFHDISSVWAAADPRSAEAREAVAMSLFLLGEPSAMDTLMRAKALALDARERRRVAETEVWMRVQFALPDDLRALHTARELADSLLRRHDANPTDPHTLASVAALTGHAFEAEQIERGVVSQTLDRSATPVAALSRSLLVFAAFGGPADSLTSLEARIESLVVSVIPPQERTAVRTEALGRAAQIAFPNVRLACVPSLATSRLYLVAAEASFLRGDSAAVRRDMQNVQHGREVFGAPTTIDGLYPEAWLIANTGDAQLAIMRLDQLLVKLRVTPSPIDPIHAAALVRAMALRADLARQVGDAQGARKWALAVVELWSGADQFLQPLVTRMRGLAAQ